VVALLNVYMLDYLVSNVKRPIKVSRPWAETWCRVWRGRKKFCGPNFRM